MANRDAKLIKRTIQDFSLNAGGSTGGDLLVACTFAEQSKLKTDKSLDEIARTFVNGGKVTLVCENGDVDYVGEINSATREIRQEGTMYNFDVNTTESPNPKDKLGFDFGEQCFWIVHSR